MKESAKSHATFEAFPGIVRPVMNLLINNKREGLEKLPAGGFIAALAADGTSRVTGIDIINRGYERFTEKLAGLGADFDITSAK